ncbi:MAG: efflux RND transporter periplasmic adaptor subunit [Gammaproteobacteria bacterium]
MNTPRRRGLLTPLIVLALIAALGWAVYNKLPEDGADKKKKRRGDTGPVPVEVAEVTRGPIELRRIFTGTLEAPTEVLVAPKVGGRIEQLNVDLADAVRRNQVVAVLDDAEYAQAVARARADLQVARASHAEAESLVRIAARELKRVDDLKAKGVSSASQRDTAQAEYLAKRAAVEVTQAQIASAEADLEAARIRLGYTQVTASWRGGDEQRVVAERLVDEGETVAANDPLMRVVKLDPMTAVFYVTERDYGRLRQGQEARVTTDAFPDETFTGTITRIAPVFRETTRQARVELRVPNPDLHLKPGMFARARVILERVEDTLMVPGQAITRREGGPGVFLVDADGTQALWRPVKEGIEQDDRIQVTGDGIAAGDRVVILGQQLLTDGKPLLVAAGPGATGKGATGKGAAENGAPENGPASKDKGGKTAKNNGGGNRP